MSRFLHGISVSGIQHVVVQVAWLRYVLRWMLLCKTLIALVGTYELTLTCYDVFAECPLS